LVRLGLVLVGLVIELATIINAWFCPTLLLCNLPVVTPASLHFAYNRSRYYTSTQHTTDVLYCVLSVYIYIAVHEWFE